MKNLEKPYFNKLQKVVSVTLASSVFFMSILSCSNNNVSASAENQKLVVQKMLYLVR